MLLEERNEFKFGESAVAITTKLVPFVFAGPLKRYEPIQGRTVAYSGVKYKEQGLKDKIRTAIEDDLYDILASDGMLIKRPIITNGEKALVGFKEKDWEEALRVVTENA